MKQFLLLRSNKQSGPYSTDELKQMGLKPYDLIWVEGKSAAWRYPGEIEELKSFAPPVEEQPYDRFYKKPDAVAKNQQSAAVNSTTQPVFQQAEKAPAKKEKEYKRVFVTLPSSANGNANGSTSNVHGAEKKQEHIQFMPPQQRAPEPEPEAFIPANNPPQAEPAPVRKQVVLQQSLPKDEIPEEVYFPRKKLSRSKPIAIAAVAIAMVGMVALGIWIGLRIDTKKQNASLEKKADRVPANNPDKNDGGLIGQSQANNVSAVTVLDTTTNSIVQEAAITTPVKKQSRIPVATRPNVLTDSLKDQTAVKENKDNSNNSDEEPRIKGPAAKPSMPDLEKMVSVSSNDYKVGPFGGISKLALTVTNSSDFALSLVVVQVEYMKVNKEVFKTENLYFRDMSANSSLTLDAPRSNRGNAVNYKVTLINSKDHIFHAGN